MLSQLWYEFSSFLSLIRLSDILDLLLVWFVVYRVLLLTKRSGAVQVLSGLGILALAFLASIYFEMVAFNYLLEKFFANLFLIVVILFQGEIRRALAHIGANPFFTGDSHIQETHLAEDIAKGLFSLAQRGLGALVVIEKEIALDYFIEIGTKVNASMRSEILVSIFQPQGPLHDGAVIIRDGKIMAAGCFLPLSKNPVLDKNLGTRHRAAIGLTEETDALVFVVSEENKSVGVSQAGQLRLNLDNASVRQIIYDSMLKSN